MLREVPGDLKRGVEWTRKLQYKGQQMARRKGPTKVDSNSKAALHDHLFKETFGDVAHARVELQAVLPKALSEKLNWSSLEVAQGSFIEVGEEPRFTDLLYKVELSRRPAYLYLLYEHMSTVDKWMALRFLGYLVRIWEQHRKHHPEQSLPVVVPVLLHHSKRGWSAPVDLHSLFDSQVLSEPELGEYVPQLRFILDDVSHASDEELLQRASNTSQLVVPLTLWAFRDARIQERLERTLAAWFGVMNELATAKNGLEALNRVLRYISLVNEQMDPDTILTIAEETSPAAKEIIMTLAEQWEQKGMQQGQSALLAKLLQTKFGNLPDEVVGRLQSASPSELERWAERVLTAESLQDVLN